MTRCVLFSVIWFLHVFTLASFLLILTMCMEETGVQVIDYINIGREEGGTIACGGGRPQDLPEHLSKGHFVLPTVITGLPATSRVATEEIFGPVVSVHEFDRDEDGIAMANCTHYGLAGSIWSTNLERAHRFAREVDSGILWINCWLHRDLRTAFGGMKASGNGREGGEHSLDAYSELKNGAWGMVASTMRLLSGRRETFSVKEGGGVLPCSLRAHWDHGKWCIACFVRQSSRDASGERVGATWRKRKRPVNGRERRVRIRK